MPKTRRQNPIHAAVINWLTCPPTPLHDHCAAKDHDLLVSAAPKRWTAYAPMALLPTGSFASAAWAETLSSVDDETASTLWAMILSEISKTEGATLTHLAVNQGIPRDEGDAENILRSPTGLRMLHGDFGPPRGEPGGEDAEKTLWVSTRQNGILQTWAPRWTMFSRGNVKEKARLLGFPRASSNSQWAVDLYAGIGYFVFSYAKLGMRVLCWEMNPWSVEGLRRGALANRWSVRVVQGEELLLPQERLSIGSEQITVFLEDNQRAGRRLQSLRDSGILGGDVSHVNCGLLPSSEPTWRMAWDITSHNAGEAWLHLHDNVGANDVEDRRRGLEDRFVAWVGPGCAARVPHVEQVKTFAPGVWHCVFDVHITRSNNGNT